MREAAEAGEKLSTVLSRAQTLGARSTRAQTEARQVLADPNQDWKVIKAAQDEAMRRANDYRRMQALAHREIMNLMVVATLWRRPWAGPTPFDNTATSLLC